jgi:hypothetical protein
LGLAKGVGALDDALRRAGVGGGDGDCPERADGG